MPFVRWIGEPDPVDANPDGVRDAIKSGLVTKEQIWAFNQNRTMVLEGVSIRLLGPAEGMSRHYQWGKAFGSYVVFVTDRDWKRIQSLQEADQFILAAEH